MIEGKGHWNETCVWCGEDLKKKKKKKGFCTKKTANTSSY